MPVAGPVQVVTLQFNDRPGADGKENLEAEVRVIEKNLNRISENLQKANADFVSIIAVMGTYRTGKSFLLDLLLRYLKSREQADAEKWEIEQRRREQAEWGLEHTEQEENPDAADAGAGGSAPDTKATPAAATPQGNEWRYQDDTKSPPPAWLLSNGDSKRISEGANGVNDGVGFAWRAGMDKCTQGIWLYSQPFMFRDQDGRRIAVVLMDTQGAYDSRMSKFQSATIFGLTALLSSKLIYNLQNRIEEDKIDSVDFFTTCAMNAIASFGGVDEQVFGHLELLIRDWANYGDHFTAEQCRAQMIEHRNQHFSEDQVPPDGVERVQRLKKIFESIGCHGLVHPGLPVTRPNYSGEIADIDPDFLQLLDTFVGDFFSEKFPRPSAPIGCEMTPRNFKQVVTQIIEAFADNCGDMTVGLRAANVKLKTLSHREEAIDHFSKELTSLAPDTSVLDPEKLETDGRVLEERYKREFIQKLKPFNLAREELEEEEEAYDDAIDKIFSRRRERNNAALEGAQLKITLAPVLGVGGWFLLQHQWLIWIGGVVGAGLHVQKKARDRNTAPCHPVVAQSMVLDYQAWFKNRWKDLQAIQVALQRFDPQEFAGSLRNSALTVGRTAATMAAAANTAGGPAK